MTNSSFSPTDLPAPAASTEARGLSRWLVPLVVFGATVALTVAAFPPFQPPESAYAFAVAALLWAYRRPRFKIFAVTVLGAQAVAWTIILGWLHNVTWLGLFLLGPFIGLWIGSWFLAAWWLLPRLLGRNTLIRLVALSGLAGGWVVIEWTRTWLLGGFPWLPLAASQWQRASILQIAAFTGAGGVSFVLVMMNLGFAAYAHRLWFEGKHGLGRRSPEFLAAMFLLIGCVTVQVQEALNRGPFTVPLARVAFVQPAIPQVLKWDPAQGPAILRTLETLTTQAAATQPDVILWPESSTPWALKNDDPTLRMWIEALTRRSGAPLVLGSIAIEPGPAGAMADWFNAVFAVDPTTGVQPNYYAKRKLVPFGEYVPLRPLIGWIGKFVPIGDDFGHGTSAAPLRIAVGGQPLALGALVCYEDIFPSLARASALAGADVLVVHTNNGWFGEGGAAYQHATHSVLRAVETRRPVLRDGNAGWSGWIDEFGGIRAVVLRDANGTVTTAPTTTGGTIYFRGTATVNVTRDSRWIGRQSFYTLHGDWFVGVSAALAALGWLLVRGRGPRATP